MKRLLFDADSGQFLAVSSPPLPRKTIEPPSSFGGLPIAPSRATHLTRPGNHSIPVEQMKEIEIVIIDYHRKGQAAVMAQACLEAFTALRITSTIHILRPPEAQTPLDEFPEHTQFWNLDRNHGAQQRYSLTGEIKAPWSLYLDNDLIPTSDGIEKLVEAARTHGDQYSCYGWLGHNITNVRGGHQYARDVVGREVDYILRAYLFRSEHVRTAMLDFPIFHWEDDLNIQMKIQKRLQRPSWIVNHHNNFTDLGGNEDFAHYRQPGHYERREKMVSHATSYLAST